MIAVAFFNMSWLSVTTVDTCMMHFIDLVCFKWPVSSAVIEATGSWMWLQFYPVSAISVDGFMCLSYSFWKVLGSRKLEGTW